MLSVVKIFIIFYLLYSTPSTDSRPTPVQERSPVDYHYYEDFQKSTIKSTETEEQEEKAFFYDELNLNITSPTDPNASHQPESNNGLLKLIGLSKDAKLDSNHELEKTKMKDEILTASASANRTAVFPPQLAALPKENCEQIFSILIN